jgi:hypothetical protein
MVSILLLVIDLELQNYTKEAESAALSASFF